MGKKHKKQSSTDSDDVKDKKKQKTSHASSSSKSLKDGKSITLKPCSKSQANMKIHKEKSQKRDEDEQIVSRSEFEEMKKSIIELSRSMVNLQGILVTKADLLELSLKEKVTAERREEETPKKKEEAKFTCCFDCEDACGNNEDTIFVKGFENLRPREEIRKELRHIFDSCGENGKGNDKALELSGSYMGEKELKVSMAKNNGEYYGFTNFEGCGRCPRPVRFRKPRYHRIHIDRHA